jgi:hypothetical protein
MESLQGGGHPAVGFGGPFLRIKPGIPMNLDRISSVVVIAVAFVLLSGSMVPTMADSHEGHGTGGSLRVPSAMDLHDALRMPGTPAWLNIIEASVQKDSNFRFAMVLAGAIPHRPSLLGGKIVDWVFAIDANTSTAAQGWPVPKDSPDPSEYQVAVWWDGTRFTAGVADRIPLLTGGDVHITEVSFVIDDNQLRVSVPPQLIGNPTQLAFYAVTDSRIQADVQVNPVTHEIVPLPVTSQIAESELWVQSVAPLSNFAVGPTHHGCSYTDDLGFLVSDCWVNWSAVENGNSAVLTFGYPAWLNIVSASLTGSEMLTFQLNLGGAIPEKPDLLGGKYLAWEFLVDTSRPDNPAGWPFPNGRHDEDEYIVTLIYDGTQFAAVLADRTPELSGGGPVISPIQFEKVGRSVLLSVPISMIGSPAEFGIIAFTKIDYTPTLRIVSPTEVVAGPGSSDKAVLAQAGVPPFCSYFTDVDQHCYTTYRVPDIQADNAAVVPNVDGIHEAGNFVISPGGAA